MGHAYPPEDPRSAASTFAPHQPNAGGHGVVADDKAEEDESGAMSASDANEKFADEPLRDTGPGPDRVNYKRVGEMSDDEVKEAAELSGEVPKGEGRKGKATRERDAKRAKEAEKARADAKPLTPSAADSSAKSSPKSK